MHLERTGAPGWPGCTAAGDARKRREADGSRKGKMKRGREGKAVNSNSPRRSASVEATTLSSRSAGRLSAEEGKRTGGYILPKSTTPAATVARRTTLFPNPDPRKPLPKLLSPAPPTAAADAFYFLPRKTATATMVAS
jgi:hypothetical protein